MLNASFCSVWVKTQELWSMEYLCAGAALRCFVQFQSEHRRVYFDLDIRFQSVYCILDVRCQSACLRWFRSLVSGFSLTIK